MLTGVTIGAMSNPAVILPLSITNVSLGATGTLTGVWSKSVIKRVKKHQKIYLLANNTLGTVNELLSESLKDSHISDKEFKKIQKIYKDYIWNCKIGNDEFIVKSSSERDETTNEVKDTFSSQRGY